MAKIYSRVNWKDYPSEETPINAQNLNQMDKGINDLDDKVNLIEKNRKPLVLYEERAEEYKTDATVGDETLKAILEGKQILVNVPNADGGSYTKIFSPVYMYQLPNYQNQYLYLFYLRDEKQTLDLSALGMGTIQLPVYGELKMKLSEVYDESPLA